MLCLRVGVRHAVVYPWLYYLKIAFFLFVNDGNFSSLQVTEDLARAGLESSNLIVGVDFTKSNEWTG